MPKGLLRLARTSALAMGGYRTHWMNSSPSTCRSYRSRNTLRRGTSISTSMAKDTLSLPGLIFHRSDDQLTTSMTGDGATWIRHFSSAAELMNVGCIDYVRELA